MLIDLIIIVLYAGFMLLIGWYSLRRTHNREEFLVAGRNLGTPMYLGTMAATILGGASTIGTVGLGYKYGISGFWLCATLGLGVAVLNIFLAPHLIKLRIYTVTQVLERRYNPSVRRVSAIIMMVNTTMVSVTSALAMGAILRVLFGIELWQAILLSGGIVVIYSAIGGMWSITITDFVQFIIQTIGIMFILFPIALYKAGGIEGIRLELPMESFSFDTIGISTIVTFFLIYFLGIMIGQDVWQRAFTAKNAKVAQRGGFLTAIYCIVYGLILALIGMCARILLPDLGVENSDAVLATMLQTELPVGIRGIVIAAILSALMSTASATLLASATVFTEDIMPVIAPKAKVTLPIYRGITFIFGGIVLLFAMIFTDVVSALSVAYNLLVGGMLVPLIGAIYWKRGTTSGAIVSMILGFGTVIAFIIIDGITANTPIYYGLAVSIVSFIVVSLLSEKPDPATISLAEPKPALNSAEQGQ